MAVNAALLHHLHLRGNGLAAPVLYGGGFFGDLWGHAKRGVSALKNTIIDTGKRAAQAIMPIVVDVGKQAAQNAGQTFLTHAVQGNVREGLRQGAAAGLGALRREGLREELKGALRPVF